MLTIGKLGASRGQLRYYEQQVAAGVEDYYAGTGEAPGVWHGTGVDALGLNQGERVERGPFMALMQGRHPGDGTVLRPMGKCSTVAALDLTFSAPKSVSVLFAIADDETSDALRDAHERGVDEALAYLEREACFTRRGHSGAERVRGGGFIAAAYRHRMSRTGDPQLHTHMVVANMTLAQGRHTALDAHALYEHKSAAGAVYRAVLRAEVRERLPWVSWCPAGRGLFEIEGIPDLVLRHFSQRRVEIEERAKELAGAGEGVLSRERMQGIALATRRAKAYGVDGPSWREQARARAAEHGLGEAELSALHDRRATEADSPGLEQLFARLSGPDGLTAMHNAFACRHAIAEIAGTFEQGATTSQLEDATSRYLDDPGVQRISPEGERETRYTTLDLLAHESRIINAAERRNADQTDALARGLVDRVLARHQPPLTDDQAAAVHEIASRGRGIETVQALAGTGKTTMIGALADAYRLAGWRILGAAPTGRAARQLRNVAGIAAGTMHALVGELEWTDGFSSRTVLVIDEAGMAPTRITAELLAHAEQAGAKVIAIGDPGQLGSVEAGGWLAALSRRQPGPQLREAVRQRDGGERRALEALHDGRPGQYLAHKQEAIAVHATEADARSALVEQWHAAQREHGASAVMIARDNYASE
ncbi:MAG: MobF family relaxase, partial [Solirubrobacteraceae bacterium]